MANKIYNQDKVYAGNFSLNYFDGLNIGAITTFAGDTVPEGYLECDGSAVSRTTYAELFLVIGEKFGAGDGSASFNLPKIIDATAPTLKYLIKATTGGSAVNNATNTTRGFVRFATDSEAEFSVKDDVAITPKHLKLAVSKTDSKSKIYGTDSDGKQTLYEANDFIPKVLDDVAQTEISLPPGLSGDPTYYLIKNNIVMITLNRIQSTNTGEFTIPFDSNCYPKTGQIIAPFYSYENGSINGFARITPQGIRVKFFKANQPGWGSIVYTI